MNREIKFRAWDKINERMISDFLAYSIQMARGELATGGYIEGGIIDVWEEFKLPSQPFIVMQFTGLLDSKGKEIYESDIVRILGSKFLWEIHWNLLGKFTFRSMEEYREQRDMGNVCEIIGNIYEDTHLLN